MSYSCENLFSLFMNEHQILVCLYYRLFLYYVYMGCMVLGHGSRSTSFDSLQVPI